MRIHFRFTSWVGFVLSGFISSLLIIVVGFPTSFNLLWIVPITYSVLTFFCFLIKTDLFSESISGLVFNLIMFLRAVLLPALLALSDYDVVFVSNMPNAILLFEYEMIIEYLFFSFICPNKKQLPNTRSNLNYSINNYYAVLGIIVSLLLICLILAPMAVNYYRTIFGITDYSYTGFDSRRITSLYATNIIRKFGLVTFRYVMNVARIVIPAVLLLFVKRYNNSVLNKISLILSIFVFNFLIVDDTLATSVFNTLIILIFYRIVLGKNSKGITGYLALTIIIVGLYFSIRTTFDRNTNLISQMNGFAQAYFGGLNNISAGLNMHVDDFFMKMKYAIYEVLRGIPYASTIFRLDDTNISTLFNHSNSMIGQIVPTICSGKLYFGYAFAPIYPLLFIAISLNENRKIDYENKPLRLLSRIVICIYSLMGISVYSPEITWTSIICVGLLIRMLSYLFEGDVNSKDVN